MKKLLVFGIIILLVGMSVSSTGLDIDKKSNVSFHSELDTQLSKYGLETRDTIKDFEQTLYRIIYKNRWINPFLSHRLKKDIAELSDVLHDMGISDDMTIAEALPIIGENKESLQDKGINLFCTIDIESYGMGAGCWPIFRMFKVLYGNWVLGFQAWVEIYNPIIGLQYCDENTCEKGWTGEFIGMIGGMTINLVTFPTIPEFFIVGKFTLYSKCDVPFVNSTTDYTQNQNPYEQQITDENHGLSNVHEGVGGHVK